MNDKIKLQKIFTTCKSGRKNLQLKPIYDKQKFLTYFYLPRQAFNSNLAPLVLRFFSSLVSPPLEDGALRSALVKLECG